jgi:glycerate-2-kinase
VSFAAALRAHDSRGALEAVGDALVTGPTATNVNDLFVFVLGTEERHG